MRHSQGIYAKQPDRAPRFPNPRHDRTRHRSSRRRALEFHAARKMKAQHV